MNQLDFFSISEKKTEDRRVYEGRKKMKEKRIYEIYRGKGPEKNRLERSDIGNYFLVYIGPRPAM